MLNETPAPLVWRIPAWQPAALFVVAAGCAAVNLYASPSTGLRILTVLVAVVAFAAAVFGIRVYFVVDHDGIGVRKMFRERSVDWSDIAEVSVIQRRFEVMTLRVICHDGRYLDVPQSLLLPTKPSGKATVRARMGDVARQVMSYGEPYRD